MRPRVVLGEIGIASLAIAARSTVGSVPQAPRLQASNADVARRSQDASQGPAWKG